MAEKEKYISEALLSEIPKKKVGLVLGPGVVTTLKIADKAVTREKLEKSVQNVLDVLHYIDCGQWVDGSTLEEPSYRNGAYLCNELNPDTGLVETHDVWHNNQKWRCLRDQPVISGNTVTYHEPWWNDPYWQMIEGDDTLRLEFSSSNGYSFRRGEVSTTITPFVKFGTTDISGDLPLYCWSWSRSTEEGTSAADRTWTLQHQEMRELVLTNSDMPNNWRTSNRVIFTMTATIQDGNDSYVVQREIRIS